jgi:uncharacterized protein (DUF2062 family)
MVFGRRVKPDWRQRLRGFIWPKSGLKRSTRYIIKRVSRLNASPHAIAAGFAAGAAASFTPFLGFHFLLGFAIAWVARGSFIASAFGTAVGNPLTFPFIFAATWETGHTILGLLGGAPAAVAHVAEDGETHGQALIEQGFFSSGLDTLWPAIKTMTIGSLPLGLLAFGAFYILMRCVVSAFQKSRRARRAHKAASRLARQHAAPRNGLPADA